MSLTIPEITAVRLTPSVDANGFPSSADWAGAQPVSFCHDWQGANTDPQRATDVSLLWDQAALYVRFVCRYRWLTVYNDVDPNSRRDYLWERDVAELFVQPDRFGTRFYKEFEIAPNGCWLDLDITPQGLQHIASGMRSSVTVDSGSSTWTAMMAIPINSLVSHFDPAHTWRVNFFRCEGSDPERFYSSWQPTRTPEPQFHVPEVFGLIRFAGA